MFWVIPSMHGFKAKHLTLLLTAVHDWTEALNYCLSTHCAFLDCAKAFDSVSHESC